jgi:hypothetical protein
MEPVSYNEDIDNEYIVRPKFAEGQEIIAYRDVHMLHSSPDVAYRTSVMRLPHVLASCRARKERE